MYERMANGVKERTDGKGDAWAIDHRNQLGTNYYLQDVDALMGHVAFAHNTGERFFLEYAPDHYENRGKTVRQFAVIAMFDRKRNTETAFDTRNTISTALYLHLCRTIGNVQPIAPRFFFVIGGDNPPWRMIEIDITSGERSGNTVTLDGKKPWAAIWAELGLSEMRRQLAVWIQRQ